jgi:hypothetical protein
MTSPPPPDFLISNVGETTGFYTDPEILTKRKTLLDTKLGVQYKDFIKYQDQDPNKDKIVGINIFKLYTELTKPPATPALATPALATPALATPALATPALALETFKNTLKDTIKTLRSKIFEDNTASITTSAASITTSAAPTPASDVTIDNAKAKFKNFAVNSSVIKILTVIYAFVVFAEKNESNAAAAAPLNIGNISDPTAEDKINPGFLSLIQPDPSAPSDPTAYNPFMFKSKPIFQYLKPEQSTTIITALLKGDNPGDNISTLLVNPPPAGLEEHLKKNKDDVAILTENLAKKISQQPSENLYPICKQIILQSVRKFQYLQAKSLDNYYYALDTANLYTNLAVIDQ